MAVWIKCTAAGVNGAPIYVNADKIISVIERECGTRLMYGSGNAAYIDVVETAEEFIRATGKAMRDAGRTNRDTSAMLIGKAIEANG